MTAVPFIYFSIIALCLYRKRKGVDFAIAMSSLYAISGFFSILIDYLGIRSYDTEHYEISFFASFSYCFLLTLSLLPFIKYSNYSIHKLKPISNEKLLNAFAWISFIWFLAFALFTIPTLIRILTGNLGELRNALYSDDSDLSYMNNIPSALRPVFLIASLVFSCPWMFLFLAFYSIITQKKKGGKLFILFLIASLSGPLTGILGVDRSKMTYWIISLIMMYVFFRPLMDTTLRKKARWLIVLLLLMSGLYLVTMTISRFVDNVSGGDNTTGGYSVISYLGQSYINFCYFFDSFESPMHSLRLIFPFISHFVFGEEVGAVHIQEILSTKTGKATGVFYTYLGQIKITAGLFATFVFAFIHYFISMVYCKFINKREVNIMNCFVYILLASFIFLGLFVYYYSNYFMTTSIISFIIIIKLLQSHQKKC